MEPLRAKVTRGAGWLLAATSLGKLLQLGAAAVTTRILSPAEFGLLAVAAAVTLLVDRLTSFSLGTALIQQQRFSTKELDVAWSYEVSRGLVLYAITAVAAPGLASLFGQPAAVPLIRIGAMSLIINGMRNVGALRLYRNLDFRALCILDLAPIAAYAAVAVIATWQFRSIWALVAASLTASVVSVAISYTVFPHRPRFDFSWSVAKPMFAFGLFLLGNALLQTCREQGMVFLLSRAMDLDQLGYYNRATAFSLALFSQGWTLVWRLTYPTFAKLQTDPARLRAAWSKSTRWLGSAALGGAAGYCLLSPPVVELVLGESWRPIVPLMQIFGLYALLWFSAASAEALFQAVGRPSIGTRINLVTTMAVLGVGYFLVRGLGVAGAAWAHVAGQALTLPLVIFTCSRLLTRRIRQVKNAATTGDGVLVERQNSTLAPGPGKTGGGELP